MMNDSYLFRKIHIFQNIFHSFVIVFAVLHFHFYFRFSFALPHGDGIMLENVVRKNVKFILLLFFKCMRIGSCTICMLSIDLVLYSNITTIPFNFYGLTICNISYSSYYYFLFMSGIFFIIKIGFF